MNNHFRFLRPYQTCHKCLGDICYEYICLGYIYPTKPIFSLLQIQFTLTKIYTSYWYHTNIIHHTDITLIPISWRVYTYTEHTNSGIGKTLLFHKYINSFTSFWPFLSKSWLKYSQNIVNLSIIGHFCILKGFIDLKIPFAGILT